MPKAASYGGMESASFARNMDNKSYTVLILEDYLPVTKTLSAAIQSAHLPCDIRIAKWQIAPLPDQPS